MNRKKVFVFPCGSEIGLEIYRSLWCAKEVDLWGGSSVPDHGRFVYRQHIPDIPFESDGSFLDHVNKLIHDQGFDYIIPAHDSVVLRLAEAHHLRSLACRALTSPLETCRIARSKKLTLEHFQGTVPTPRLYTSLADVSSWPVFLKPDVGQGSKGTVLASSPQEAQYHLLRGQELLILEYLPGKEYTVDCFTDRNGKLLFAGGRERRRIANGISVNTRPAKLNELREVAAKINAKLHFTGMWFFQVKENAGGELALMEIAPRLAGTMGMYRNLGINFSLMSIYDAEGLDLHPLVNVFDIEMDRALGGKFKLGIDYTDVYMDFDDCLILDEQINTQAICFLFQCLNKGVRIHLITRHAQDVEETLRKFRLDRMFDSVVTIAGGEKKSAYITGAKAIFIDDSFSERFDVSTSLGIPVFAPDSIESLLD
ncbi:MAG: ATP-grasp domain-containing protein [Syntrophobacteraceae bacterium]|nr:ATP-grasp domain-containing protein [Syntrophobacteraceae bacterium]